MAIFWILVPYINAIFTDICQLRLDFFNFDITEATTGLCTDSFIITGPTGDNPDRLCGTLTGSHSKNSQIAAIMNTVRARNDRPTLHSAHWFSHKPYRSESPKILV